MTPSQPTPPTDEAVILLTGFPSYVARRVCRELLRRRSKPRIHLLHDGEADSDALDTFLQGLPAAQRSRVLPLAGHVTRLDLGVASPTYRQLAAELTDIHHLAWAFGTGAGGGGERLRKVNVRGTREVVELAGQCTALRRLVHWSTVHVSGCRQGVVLEEELDCGQRFHSRYEQTRYEAERLVRRAARTLPVTVLRPGVIVGDSETGELEAYEGPYRLFERFLGADRGHPVLLPGSGDAPVHLVPVDFVTRAGVQLSLDPAAEGQTFHLVDPSPLPAHKIYELVARKAHRRPHQRVIPGLVSRVLRAHPRVERLSPFPVAPAELFDAMVLYNCQNTLTHLAGTDLRCPPFPAYVERLIQYARAVPRDPETDPDLPNDPLA
jgi:thioester reductase-like protein